MYGNVGFRFRVELLEYFGQFFNRWRCVMYLRTQRFDESSVEKISMQSNFPNRV